MAGANRFTLGIGSPEQNATTGGYGLEAAIAAISRLAREGGEQLTAGRHWVETTALVKRPLMTLSAAFALGVITGWLVKRR
jgi:hypothetical protein